MNSREVDNDKLLLMFRRIIGATAKQGALLLNCEDERLESDIPSLKTVINHISDLRTTGLLDRTIYRFEEIGKAGVYSLSREGMRYLQMSKDEIAWLEDQISHFKAQGARSIQRLLTINDMRLDLCELVLSNPDLSLNRWLWRSELVSPWLTKTEVPIPPSIHGPVDGFCAVEYQGKLFNCILVVESRGAGFEENLKRLAEIFGAYLDGHFGDRKSENMPLFLFIAEDDEKMCRVWEEVFCRLVDEKLSNLVTNEGSEDPFILKWRFATRQHLGIGFSLKDGSSREVNQAWTRILLADAAGYNPYCSQ